MKLFELQIFGEMLFGKNLNRYLWIIILICLAFLFFTRTGGAVDSRANPEILKYAVTRAGETDPAYAVTIQFRGEAVYIANDSDETYSFELHDDYTAGLRETLATLDVNEAQSVPLDGSRDTVTFTADRYWDEPLTWNVGQLPPDLEAIAGNLEDILSAGLTSR